MRPWILVIVSLAVVWPHGVADAKCKSPRAFFTVPSDARVPANPVIHLFTPRRHAPAGKAPPPLNIVAHDATGRRAVPVTVLETTHAPSFEASAVQALTINLGDIVFRVTGLSPRFEATATVKVVASFAPPSGTPVTIRRTEAESFFWTCSRQHSRNLTPSIVAPAYRVVWASSRTAFDAGKRQSFIVPDAMGGFFGVDAESKAVVELGTSNCIGRTFDFAGRHAWVALQALHADGIATPLGPPRRVSPPK
ncbi:MAG TPA: hypothetical protein ENK57_14290 [Polyangiaceae bacterium]|nr:hypothetical protein [Polyangiaceae bacterium]